MARNILDMKDGDQSAREEPTFPNLTLAFGKPIYDETLVGEIQPLNVAEAKEYVQGDDDEEDNMPLSWRMKRPSVHFEPVSTMDHVSQDKGKGNFAKSRSSVVVRSYTTRGTEKKLLGDAMKASRQKQISKKRLRKTTVVKPDISEDQVVNVGEDEDIN